MVTNISTRLQTVTEALVKIKLFWNKTPCWKLLLSCVQSKPLYWKGK